MNLHRLIWLRHMLCAPKHKLNQCAMLDGVKVGWKNATGGQTKQPMKYVRRWTHNWDQGLETLGETTQNWSQWHIFIVYPPLNLLCIPFLFCLLESYSQCWIVLMVITITLFWFVCYLLISSYHPDMVWQLGITYIYAALYFDYDWLKHWNL